MRGDVSQGEFMTSARTCVVEAAVKWARALELQAEADEKMSDEMSADAVLRQAEVELYVAVLSWRAQMSGTAERQQTG
jgi:hypothetical protein